MTSVVVRRAQQQLLQSLRDEVVQHTFFEHQRRRLFPDAVSIEQVKVQFPAAFSRDSVLTKIFVTVRTRAGKVMTHTLRGNTMEPNVAKLLHRVEAIPVPTPEVKWYSTPAHYLLYESVPGVPLRTLPFTSGRFARAVEGAGAALAELHRRPIRSPIVLPWAAETGRLQELNRGTLKYSASLRVVLRDAGHAVRKPLQRWWTTGPMVVAHNDYQGSNILVDGPQIGIIDFSRSGRGPLPIDAGQFLAHLTVMTTPRLSPVAQLHLRAKFLGAYQRRLLPLQRRALVKGLPAFEIRAALDIALITAAFVPSARRATRLIQPLIPTLQKRPL